MSLDPAPRGDYGLFGPGSVTWKVYRYPTSVTVGFQRTALVEMFDPLVVASVAGTDSLRSRAADRYDRTLEYAASVVFGSSEDAVRAADTLMRIHTRVTGTDPVTGRLYAPNDPDGQLWIHLTQWQSVLHVYERFGPGRLTDEEDRQYWAECAQAAVFQTIDPDTVPRSREEMRDYYRRRRPALVASPLAVEHALLILDTANELFSAVPGPAGRVVRPVLARLGRRATVATLPRWMREAMGLRQGPVVDALAVALARLALRVAATRTERLARVLAQQSPLAYPVIAPAALDVPPVEPVTVEAHEAWRRAGRPTPREQYLAATTGSATGV